MFITIEQVKAARALAGWAAEKLANQAGLTADQVRNFESGRARSLDVVETIHKTFSKHGIEFIADGVRKKKHEIRALQGQQGFWDFYDDIYRTIHEHGGEILVHNVDEALFLKWLGPEFWAMHSARMSQLNNFQQKIIVCEGDTNYVAKFSTTRYRWAKKEEFSPTPFYLYGPKLAMMTFEENDVTIFVIDQPKITLSYKNIFMSAWARAIIPPVNLEQGEQ